MEVSFVRVLRRDIAAKSALAKPLTAFTQKFPFHENLTFIIGSMR
jgi:hypothetical protein